MRLKRAFVSLGSDSDGPTLVLDYVILPKTLDEGHVFAASFSPEGSLLGVWHEG